MESPPVNRSCRQDNDVYSGEGRLALSFEIKFVVHVTRGNLPGLLGPEGLVPRLTLEGGRNNDRLVQNDLPRATSPAQGTDSINRNENCLGPGSSFWYC